MGIGIIGTILPLIPTTPLLLVALACFVRGSKKFEDWFKGTSLYKKYLQEFVKNRELTLKQKVTILLLSDLMIAIAFIMTESIFLRIFLILVEVYKYYYFIYNINTKKTTDSPTRRMVKQKDP